MPLLSPLRFLHPQRLASLPRTLWRQRWVRACAWGIGGVYVVFGLLVLVLRYGVLPHVNDYRPDVEAALTKATKLPVSIRRIDADWQGLRPRLTLAGLEIRDKSNRPALSFDQVQAVLGWSSVPMLEPHLYRLEIQSPQLAVRRDAAGHLFVAGLEVETKSTEPGLPEWLLRQRQIVVKDAAISWTDEQRGAPTLTLAQLNINLLNGGSRHRFGITAQPPEAMAARLDLRGDLRGGDLSDLKAWSGQLYVETERADLAVWRTWMDYPVDLPRGTGGLRLWLELANGQPAGVTADLSLKNLTVRLARDLPTLELNHLQGRLQGKRWADGFEISSSGLTLSTADGIRIDPLNTKLRWQALSGEFTSNHLELDQLVRFAGHLPLSQDVRDRLTKHDPRGRLIDFHMDWHGNERPFEHYKATGRMDKLSWLGEGGIPGASGISGSLDGNEKGGKLSLTAKDGSIDLPEIFAESRIPFAALDAQVSWKRSGADFDVTLEKATVRNKDAEGTAKGTYRSGPGRFGTIDLDAQLTRAEGNAVWRYLPKVVNADVISWVKGAVVAGKSDNLSLKLKGDLDRFPFTDGSGAFLIRGNIRDGILNYGPGWPRIEGIAGELLFDKARMLITAQRGNILGTSVGPVSAELPDLDSHDPVLTVLGKAKGDTPAFLRFLEASPVGGYIGHPTVGMSANGNGELDLKLGLPLNHINDAKVSGGYRFDGNRVIVDDAAPPLDDVRGRLEFSEKGVAARDLRARILGGPAAAEVKTLADGTITVDAHGEVSAAQLRVQPYLSWLAPALEFMSGSTRWDGTVRVKKGMPEVRVSSDLRGISSSLPDPFNKPATEARPFLLEHKAADPRLYPARSRGATVSRDELDVTVGRSLKVQLIGATEGARHVTERGLIAINPGPATRLPERGTLLAVNVPKVNLDLVRRLMAETDKKDKMANAPASSADGVSLSLIDLRTDEALAFGHRVHDLRVLGNLRGEHWLADLKSKELSGRFDWLGTGKGKLSGRISQFSLSESGGGSASAASSSDVVADDLPALDLTFDRFVYGGKDFGELRVMAENTAGTWHANFNAQQEDAALSGEGRWKPGSDTQLDFKLKVRSLERWLGRMGYPNAVKRGSANVEGKLSWVGSPQSFDYPTLSGNLQFSAKDGQFDKLEPGVGRLLGILSLQSLPRRITLDFRDIFSQGFAFDSIDGQAQIAKGVLDTRDLEIKGPAARVAMQGTVDLVRETQNLRVRVQPALGETVTTGIMLANPAVGLAYWVGNKLFGRPLDQIFAFEYAVTGPWADPQVNKVGGGMPKDAKEVTK
ncbi:MAG TPA: YhdP family protein [Rhodocyclaceae bacterium]|nr:YhdP family protein [Rhodocyclaceae bacterium]